MNPSASSDTKWKIENLRSLVTEELSKSHCLPFIAVTETWLKYYIKDAQVNIPNYVVSRCDRNKRIGGGVLLYSHENVPVTSCATYDDGICQVLFCCFETIAKTVTVCYRPPNAPSSSFQKAMTFIESQLSEINNDSYKHCITGDFNFPLINWDAGLISPGGTLDEKTIADILLKFISDNLMNQFIHYPHSQQQHT